MRRGAVVTVATGGGYGGKPRPAAVIQDDRFEFTESLTLCLFTTVPADAGLIRLQINPSASNGLLQPSFLMIDKIVTANRDKVDRLLGQLDRDDIVRLNRALVVFLGLAG